VGGGKSEKVICGGPTPQDAPGSCVQKKEFDLLFIRQQYL
jgi:hypothetical protein